MQDTSHATSYAKRVARLYDHQTTTARGRKCAAYTVRPRGGNNRHQRDVRHTVGVVTYECWVVWRVPRRRAYLAAVRHSRRAQRKARRASVRGVAYRGLAPSLRSGEEHRKRSASGDAYVGATTQSSAHSTCCWRSGNVPPCIARMHGASADLSRDAQSAHAGRWRCATRNLEERSGYDD